MTVEEAKLKYGDPERNYYVDCCNCPFYDDDNNCIELICDEYCSGLKNTWEWIADRFNKDKKDCDNCKHSNKDMMEHPCVICNHGGGADDDDFLWESPQCVPEIVKEVDDILKTKYPPGFIPTELVPTETTDNVNHPSHYNNGGMECIDEMILIFGVEATKHFCLLNAWKYRYRANHKNGQEDLDKANWYIAKYKELSENE